MENNTVHRALAKEAARIEEDATCSAKGHFEAAKSWSRIHLWLGLPTAVIAGVSGISAFQEKALLAGALAIMAAALASVSTFLNASDRANAYHSAGVRFNSLRNRARIFRTIDLASNASVADLSAMLKDLATDRDILNESSPQIPMRAFERARKGIEAGEATYRIDAQTDK